MIIYANPPAVICIYTASAESRHSLSGHYQGGLHPEVRLDDNMVIFPLKSSQDECVLIRLQIEFVFDMWVTHHNILYYQEITKDLHHY